MAVTKCSIGELEGEISFDISGKAWLWGGLVHGGGSNGSVTYSYFGGQEAGRSYEFIKDLQLAGLTASRIVLLVDERAFRQMNQQGTAHIQTNMHGVFLLSSCPHQAFE